MNQLSDITTLFSSSRLRENTRGDKVIWALVVVLSLVSLLVVYSATNSLAYKLYKGNTFVYLFKQILFIGAGIIIIYFAHRVNYTVYSRVAKILFFVSIPLLFYTLKFGTNLNEANRWIKLPVINLTFQTSDLAKLALFMFLSHLLSRKQDVIKDFRKGFVPLMLPVIAICGLIAPANLSTALLTGATSMLLLFIGRVRVKHILLVASFVIVPVIILIGIASAYYDQEEGKMKELPAILSVGRVPTWIKRVQDFRYASKDEAPYQVQQAKIAVAKGGMLGLGPGNSEQRNFLPHPYSDFIYAIIIEEYGLLGGGFIVFIYLVFLFRSIRLFRKCPYAFGAFLSLALSITLVIQAMTNMAVNVGLFPVTGVTLPLVSMGGSSFLFTCLSIGIILSVARNVEDLEGEKEPAKTAAA
ncbi:MAG TPA: FtsW/RodA/SpoVE family cell cycle protein [Lacibacter sp.]|nr:FtsW/RodA/SpoVE family cell cycle protein [Lacibacter sp.]HMO87817.1 FtsW/RodA/SpoVE family cell cycle protein [Lacibacter sp.]HMP87046.1 FtsW/RodA/SpoVE family cell cycle protein [Lacibacter sp.]